MIYTVMEGQGKSQRRVWLRETILLLRACALADSPAWTTLPSSILMVVMSSEGLAMLPCLQAIKLSAAVSWMLAEDMTLFGQR